jgi:hypothetical protein
MAEGAFKDIIPEHVTTLFTMMGSPSLQEIEMDTLMIFTDLIRLSLNFGEQWLSITIHILTNGKLMRARIKPAFVPCWARTSLPRLTASIAELCFAFTA